MILRILATVVAFLAALVVLLGTLLPISPFVEARLLVLQWGMVLGVFAFLLAFLHLMRVHLVRLRRGGKHAIPSLIIVLTALATTGIVLWERIVQGDIGPISRALIDSVLVPGESTLLALTAVTLTLSGMRLLRTHRNAGSLLFLGVVLVMLLGSVPYLTILGSVANWMQRVLATPGMRGLVMGVVLGTVVAGLRIIFVTRAYSDD